MKNKIVCPFVCVLGEQVEAENWSEERETEGYGDSKMMAVLVWTVNILDKDFWIFFLVSSWISFCICGSKLSVINYCNCTF